MGANAWLPPRTAALIDQTVAALRSALGGRLEAAALVGTAVNPAHQHRARAPEIVAVVLDGEPLDLAALAAALHRVMGDGARVRVLTRGELDRSCDVFALEIAEWKERHHLLHGDDPFAGLAPSRSDLRRSIETELRGLTRRMRNRVLAALATDRRRDDPDQAVVDGVDRFLVAAHHTLGLLGETPPAEEPALIHAVAAKADVNPEPLVAELEKLRSANARVDPVEVLRCLLLVVERVTEFIDCLPEEA